MLNSKGIWFDRLNGVEIEYQAVRRAVIALLESERRAGGRLADLLRASDNLEGTYFVRQFAVFEFGLRDYWATTQKGGRGKRPRSLILTRNLIDSVAGRFALPDSIVTPVQAVREYRNALTHGFDAGVSPVCVALARSRLSTFFARLAETW